MPKVNPALLKKGGVKKVLILGSGALKIGQAGEFDYSGSQAIKAFKEEGVETLLVNPNIATVQTDEGLADKIYFLPVTPDFVRRVIEKERPDSIALSFGGQTSLNCGLSLAKDGTLSRYKVKVLGTSVKSIEDTEDREKFRRKLESIKVSAPRGKTISSLKEGISFGRQARYPVFVRIGFALGGQGSGVARNERQLKELLAKTFSLAKTALIEEYLEGWKEVEYEMMRDQKGNCIAVCNMENVDAMGVHTGESIVVAPSQTLSNYEYHFLREICQKVVQSLEIVGECNVQLAISPNSGEYRVIEVNARLSRSSALASKATGYPIAFVAAKLSLGYTLEQLENRVTKKTKAFFEPALDYVVVKVPRWDLQKFRNVKEEIGSEMKSVGEVMAIGRTFEESLQKALRMLEKGIHGLLGDNNFSGGLKKYLATPNEKRIIAAARALEKGWSVPELSRILRIDKWFLQRIKNVVRLAKELKTKKLTKDLLLRSKQVGFSDWQIGHLVGSKEGDVRGLRKSWRIFPYVKQIDTMAAEWPASTNYLYTTYNGDSHDINKTKKQSVIILGSGAYRIGSSVEFDWCSMQAVKAARKAGFETIMLNCNPETVSTDFDECDRLYFDELSLERVMDIYEFEQPKGMVVSMAGQVGNNLAFKCHNERVRILGTDPASIDRAEDRAKFSKLLDKLGIAQPDWRQVSSLLQAKNFAKKVKYPVLLRPSYVLSGEAMVVVFEEAELKKYLEKAARVSPEYQVVVSKFLKDAKEIEMDAVAKNGRILASVISEHIEPAGTHSGDSFIVTPSQRVYVKTLREVQDIGRKIAQALKITGPFNIQFLAKDQDVLVIECNLRASRSFPFVSKVHGVNLASLAAEVLLGKKVSVNTGYSERARQVGVKAPQFSYSRLKGADPLPSVDMASTGEVGCLGKDLEEAFLKSAISVGIDPPQKSILVSVGGDKQRYELLDSVSLLYDMGYKLYGTDDTAKFYAKQKLPMKMLYKIQEPKEPNIGTFMAEKKIDFLISVPREGQGQKSKSSYAIRRLAVDLGIPLITNVNVAKLMARALKKYPTKDLLSVGEWREY